MRRLRTLAVATLASAGLLGGCAGPEPEDRTPPARAEGIRLHVKDRGAGPPLVVPGAAWLGADLGPLEPALRLVVYDPRGRGRSPRVSDDEAIGLAVDVADLERLRAHLGLERIALLGWAYYGGIAVRYALAHPHRVTRLVLVAPLPPRRRPHWDDANERFRLRADAEVFLRLEELRTSGRKERDPLGYCQAVTRAFLETYAADPTVVERMRSNPCVEPHLDPDVTAARGRAAIDALGAWDWRAELAELDVPVLLVHGSHDVVPASGTHEYGRALPDATLLELEGVGHFPWLEDPASFFPPVLEFLGRE